MNNSTVTHSAGGTCFAGAEATNLFRLITLKHGLKIEMSGMRIARNVNALKTAKQVTGLRTNKRQEHIDRIEVMIKDAAKLVNVPEPTNQPA